MKAGKLLIITALFMSLRMQAQVDSAANRWKLFDIYGTIGPGFYSAEKGSDAYYSHFTPDGQPLLVPAGYTVTNEVTEADGGGFGGAVGATFRLKKTENKFRNRIKPRVGLMMMTSQVFEVKTRLSRSTTIDTLKYTDNRLPPILIDSTYAEQRNFSFTNKQVFVEAGANFDIFTARYFNFFAGVLLSAGASYRQQLLIEETRDYYIDPYPGKQRQSSTELYKASPKFNYPTTFAFNLGIPFGMQHRFIHWRSRNTLGLFMEGRGGITYYKPPRGQAMYKPYFLMQVGFRWSFQRHK